LYSSLESFLSFTRPPSSTSALVSPPPPRLGFPRRLEFSFFFSPLLSKLGLVLAIRGSASDEASRNVFTVDRNDGRLSVRVFFKPRVVVVPQFFPRRSPSEVFRKNGDLPDTVAFCVSLQDLLRTPLLIEVLLVLRCSSGRCPHLLDRVLRFLPFRVKTPVTHVYHGLKFFMTLFPVFFFFFFFFFSLRQLFFLSTTRPLLGAGPPFFYQAPDGRVGSSESSEFFAFPRFGTAPESVILEPFAPPPFF